MTATPGPQQPDEVGTIRTEPITAAEQRERVVAEWLWERDCQRAGGPWCELPYGARPRYTEDARDLLDREELFPLAALSSQPDPCPDCGHRHNPLAFCIAKQCTACGEKTPNVGLCSDCSTFSATPSAQPDECAAVCDRMACEWCPGHDRHEATAQWLYKAVIARQNKVPADDLTPWSELTKDQRNGWRAWANELIPIVLYGIPIPAQHVRDTEETRQSGHAGCAGSAPASGNYGSHTWPVRDTEEGRR